MKATKESLQRLERLMKRSDFLSASSKGTKWVAKGMIVQANPNETGHCRAGFTVTKRLEKRAVGRNRMKRRLRAVAADVLPHAAKTGMDYVLIARTETATRPYEDLKRDLLWCLKKLGYAE